IGDQTLFAKLEDKGFAARLLVQLECQRPYDRVLIAERKARFALVGRQQVKVGKIEDISPAACDLAIGNFERSIWDCFDQARNCLRIEDAVTKVAEDNGVAGRLMNMLADLLQGATGNAAIVERIDLKQAIPAGDK